VNLNDSTVEGFRHRSLPVFSVQYHRRRVRPHDAAYLFDAFIDMMKTGKPPTGKRLRSFRRCGRNSRVGQFKSFWTGSGSTGTTGQKSSTTDTDANPGESKAR